MIASRWLFSCSALEGYQAANVYVKNGSLILEGRYENATQITSGKIVTRSDTGYAIKYGRIEAKITLPTGVGAWPSM